MTSDFSRLQAPVNQALGCLVPINLTHLASIMRVRNRNTTKLTTVTLRQDTYERLQKLGRVPESFNDIVSRILDQIEKEQKK